MPTIAEALQNAADALNFAVTKVLGLYDTYVAIFDAKVATAQTTITNFINRPAQQYLHVDPINGNDANDGLSLATAFKSLDGAFSKRDKDRFTTIYLFGDDTIKYLSGSNAPFDIIGVSNTPGGYGAAFTAAKRQISFAAEASNSPAIGIGRCVPTIIATCSYIRFANIDLRLPLVDTALQYKDCILAYGTSIVLLNSTLAVADNTSTVSLVNAGDGQPITLTATTFTLGSNGAGHLFRGIAAAANPNSDYRYKSNLTAA